MRFTKPIPTKRKLLYSSTSAVVLKEHAPRWPLSIKLGKGTRSLTVTLRRKDKSGFFRVRNWSWMWKTDVKKSEDVLNAWMNSRPGEFRMNNGQTWQEFQMQRKAQREAERKVTDQIVDDVIQ